MRSRNSIGRSTPRKRGLGLDLVGAVSGSDCLVRIGLSPGRAGLDSRNVCLRRTNGFFFGLAGFVQLVAEFVLCLLKFAHGLSHSTRQFWQFFCPEEDEDDQQNDDQIWSSQIHEAREQAHNMWLNISLAEEVAREFESRQRIKIRNGQDARWPYRRDARATVRQRQITNRTRDEFRSRPDLRLENCDMRPAMGSPVSPRRRNRRPGAEILGERSRHSRPEGK